MVTDADARAWIGERVRVQPAAAEGILRFVRPAGDLAVADVVSGRETWFSLADVTAIEDARRTCEECRGVVNLTTLSREDVPRELCATCQRAWASKQPPPVMACPECGGTPAVYSPRTKKYACFTCQGVGGLTGLGVESRVLRAVCRGADIEDERHVWKRVRMSRWRCLTCHADRFAPPATRD